MGDQSEDFNMGISTGKSGFNTSQGVTFNTSCRPFFSFAFDTFGRGRGSPLLVVCKISRTRSLFTLPVLLSYGTALRATGPTSGMWNLSANAARVTGTRGASTGADHRSGAGRARGADFSSPHLHVRDSTGARRSRNSRSASEILSGSPATRLRVFVSDRVCEPGIVESSGSYPAAFAFSLAISYKFLTMNP